MNGDIAEFPAEAVAAADLADTVATREDVRAGRGRLVARTEVVQAEHH